MEARSIFSSSLAYKALRSFSPARFLTIRSLNFSCNTRLVSREWIGGVEVFFVETRLEKSLPVLMSVTIDWLAARLLWAMVEKGTYLMGAALGSVSPVRNTEVLAVWSFVRLLVVERARVRKRLSEGLCYRFYTAAVS